MEDVGNEILTAGRNVIAWFEMPVRRLDDADINFYKIVFGYNIPGYDIVKKTDNNNRKYGLFQYKQTIDKPIEYYGALVLYLPNEEFPSCSVPSFRALNQSDYNALLNKVVCNGGQIITQCTHPILGWVAKCKDNQGNVFMIHPIIHIDDPYDTSTSCP